MRQCLQNKHEGDPEVHIHITKFNEHDLKLAIKIIDGNGHVLRETEDFLNNDLLRELMDQA